MRIGQGFDVHALVPGRKLIVGGVEIPFDRGLEGHSDADVLLHALGIDHKRLTFKYQGRHFRLTDVHGSLVKKVLAEAAS